MPLRVGGIEAGGTKFVCAVGSGADDVQAETTIPTTDPPTTLSRVVDFFRAEGPIAALGVGAFGPLDLDRKSPTFGFITNTPKPGWAETSIAGMLAPLGVPVAIDTDVNAAALGEHRWGAARGVGSFVYLTVGTGIGGGAFVNGALVHGLVHPEMGHIPIPRAARDTFPGSCPFHRDCFEGLASGPAMAARWNAQAETLPAEHPAWDLEAEYLALGLAAIVGVLSPERIIVGGGVARTEHLLPRVRTKLRAVLAGYVRSAVIDDDTVPYVVASALGQRAGVLGALALALTASRATGGG